MNRIEVAVGPGSTTTVTTQGAGGGLRHLHGTLRQGRDDEQSADGRRT